MLQVIITREEALILGSKQYGITGGKRNIETKKREPIYFCSNLIFNKNFTRDKEYINI